jgi:hypothetical protein
MKYTIKEILPGQIRVEYEDNSWAIVPIPPNSTMEEIDHAVSQYDPDFLPSVTELINSNISIGLERTSAPKIEEPKVESPQQVLNENTNIPQIPSSEKKFNNISVKTILMADYFSELGDNRLKEDIRAKIDAYVKEFNVSTEGILLQLNPIDDDYIMRQAEEELNNGK